MHNFNEDQFGLDLQKLGRAPLPTNISSSHAMHNWKQPTIEKKKTATASISVKASVLFGHTPGQKIASAGTYFFQDPANIEEGVVLGGDDFYGAGPVRAAVGWTSALADEKRQKWQEDAGALKTMYDSSYKHTVCADADLPEAQETRSWKQQHAKIKGQFSARADMHPVVRSDVKFY